MLPIQITLRDIPESPALEAHIKMKIEKVMKFFDRITSCRVIVDVPQKHKHQGKLFNARIDVTVPEGEIAISHKMDEDVYVAVRNAFNALTRKLKGHSERKRGSIKKHSDILHGHIARIMREEGYGFIEGMDGNDYYFSTTNIHHPHFDQLLVGDSVEYVSVPYSEGNQAHHVIRERNHHE